MASYIFFKDVPSFIAPGSHKSKEKKKKKEIDSVRDEIFECIVKKLYFQSVHWIYIYIYIYRNRLKL